MALSRITGDVIEQFVIYKEILWMIDTEILPEESMISSSSFKVADVDCNFSLYPNGTSKYHGMFSVILSIPLEKNYLEICCDITVQRKGFDSKHSPIVQERFCKRNIFFGFKKNSLFNKGDDVCSLKNFKVFCTLKIKEKGDIALENEKDTSTTSPEVTLIVNNKFYSQDGKSFYFETLIHDLNELRISENNSDVTIKVKTEEFRVHRNILGARTPVFTSMFQHDMSEKNTGIVTLDDCEPHVFKEFLKYVYTSEIDCQLKNACGLYEMADKYQMNELKAECLKYLMNNFSVDTFCDVISIALLHSEEELLKLATFYFCKNTRAILLTVQWQKFLKENPMYANELFLKLVP